MNVNWNELVRHIGHELFVHPGGLKPQEGDLPESVVLSCGTCGILGAVVEPSQRVRAQVRRELEQDADDKQRQMQEYAKEDLADALDQQWNSR